MSCSEPLNSVLSLLEKLVCLESVTPNDAGCQLLIASHLTALGFNVTHLPYEDVNNLWAKRGENSPLFVFAGHTDVVPTGPKENWQSPPFELTLKDGFLYGRGIADMKASIAAMIIACERFLREHPKHQGSIAFLITSDEEGHAINGTRKVMEYLENQSETIDWCLVGEPSSEKQVGDTLKIGRRGSLNANITIHGKQGHIAYPHLAINPIHLVLPALLTLCQKTWDRGHPPFPPTSFQISNICAGTGATNVIPENIEITCNFRYSPAVTAEDLKEQVTAILQHHQLPHSIVWRHAAEPFLTKSRRLLTTTQTAIQKITGQTPILSTDGGTSDGRFIAPSGCEVLEFGPCNATIHQINERVNIEDLIVLTQIYQDILQQLLT